MVRVMKKRRSFADDSESTAKTSEPVAVEPTGNTKVMPSTSQQTTGLEKNNSVTSPKVTRVEERTEEDPSSSQARPKEGASNLLLFQLKLSFLSL